MTYPRVKRPPYRGRLQATILDWAGTTVDYGCQAPTVVLHELFAERGVPVSVGEIRRHMGLLKKDQIRAICSIPRVEAGWRERHGGLPSEQDVTALFQEFIPRQLACLDRHSELIPGVAGAVARLRARGMKIGTTTGYTRPMLDIVLRNAMEQGYTPDATVCPEEAGGGRPRPWMCYRNAILLQVDAMEACVKIGDTVSDVQEGLNAGAWTIAVVETGNEVGLTEPELRALGGAERQALLREARARLAGVGAHYVIDSIADCDGVLDDIEFRLHEGEAP